MDDVRHRDGIDYIDINAVDEEKSLKTRSSRRQVPLHPELVRLGFLDHVERRRASGGGPLFPDLKPDNHGVQTGNFSKWWGRHARRRGIEDRRKTFHSFRHGFKQAIREAGVGEEVHDALTGHSGGGVGRTYGGYPLGLKAGAIAKVKYPGLDLSSMYDRPVRKRSRPGRPGHHTALAPPPSPRSSNSPHQKAATSSAISLLSGRPISSAHCLAISGNSMCIRALPTSAPTRRDGAADRA